MSGGSFNYFYTRATGEASAIADDLARFVSECARDPRLAAVSAELVRAHSEAELLATRLRLLEPVTQALEWWVSGDAGVDGVRQAWADRTPCAPGSLIAPPAGSTAGVTIELLTTGPLAGWAVVDIPAGGVLGEDEGGAPAAPPPPPAQGGPIRCTEDQRGGATTSAAEVARSIQEVADLAGARIGPLRVIVVARTAEEARDLAGMVPASARTSCYDGESVGRLRGKSCEILWAHDLEDGLLLQTAMLTCRGGVARFFRSWGPIRRDAREDRGSAPLAAAEPFCVRVRWRPEGPVLEALRRRLCAAHGYPDGVPLGKLVPRGLVAAQEDLARGFVVDVEMRITAEGRFAVVTPLAARAQERHRERARIITFMRREALAADDGPMVRRLADRIEAGRHYNGSGSGS